jgi:hypothetical protein
MKNTILAIVLLTSTISLSQTREVPCAFNSQVFQVNEVKKFDGDRMTYQKEYEQGERFLSVMGGQVIPCNYAGNNMFGYPDILFPTGGFISIIVDEFKRPTAFVFDKSDFEFVIYVSYGRNLLDDHKEY